MRALLPLFRPGRTAPAWLRTVAAVAALVAAPPSPATVIDFDDLPAGTLVEYQYLDRGLWVGSGDAYIVAPFRGERDPVVSPPNVLNDFGSPDLYLNFVGELPTSVGMYVTTALQDAVFLSAWLTGSEVDRAATDGWAGTEENSTPAVPRQWIELTNPGGIDQVVLMPFFFRRADVYVDDLTFVTAAVPEPPTVALLAVALLLGAGAARHGTARSRVASSSPRCSRMG